MDFPPPAQIFEVPAWQIVTVESIWSQSPHNAFPDLASYQGSLYCAFREAASHEGSCGFLRILKSGDGSKWESVAVIKKGGIDLRDPHFSLRGTTLQLLFEGAILDQEGKVTDQSPYVSFSEDGLKWTAPTDLGLKGEWIWRVTWEGDVGYGVSYRVGKEWKLTLFKTTDGVHYSVVTPLPVTEFPSETTLRFLSDKTLVALVRRRANGWIGHAKPPYTDWTWHDCGYRLGGPNFIVLNDGSLLMGARFYRTEKLEPYTAIGSMTLTSVQPELILPSSGDTGYPALAVHQGSLFVCYYSSHEEKTGIYLVKVKMGGN